MIKKIAYPNIDFVQYNRCIDQAEQRKYSATQHFLEAVAQHQWDLLVLDDYKAVMPVPYVKKWGIKWAINPKLCQQLGIFSEKDNKEINQQFLDYFQKKYSIIYYAFNAKNQFEKPIATRKNFYILPNLYATIYQKYSPKRKRKLRQDEEIKALSQTKKITLKEAENFIIENLLGAKNLKNKKEFLSIFQKMENENHLQILGYFYKEKLINCIVLYLDQVAVSLLGTFNDKEYIKFSGASILIDEAIKQHSHNKIFDFEGSEIPAVEEFFRGFRPEIEHYPFLNYTKKELFINRIKRSFRLFLKP